MRNAPSFDHTSQNCRVFRLFRSERTMWTNDPITLTAAQAASILGLALSTLAKLRLAGNGPTYCKLGRRVVYRRTDLEAWLESRVARDTSDAGARLPKSLTVPGRRTANGTTETSPGVGTKDIRRTLERGDEAYNVFGSENGGARKP
jgi:predicted DNA-binding transcriptional regulator AlpA